MPVLSTHDIPPGAISTVKIIDTTTRISNLQVSYLMGPAVDGFERLPEFPSWAFLVEHPTSGAKLLFDLGVPKDWENFAPVVSKRLNGLDWVIKVEKNIVDVLEENHVSASEITSLVWSHWHWDHLGDPSTFPSTTELIVGPGFKEAFFPGWPGKEDSPVRESDFKGRTVREISFADDKTLQIGPFQAHDLYGDGSFYLLSTPGHAIGHISALARTSTNPDTFIFMGGDICHHAAQLRPSDHLPLPAKVTPHPWIPSHSGGGPLICPGAVLEQVQQSRGRSVTEPIYDPAGGLSIEEATRTVRQAQDFDGSENVFFVFAHETSIMGVADLFPKDANAWKEKGWRDKTLWRFLRDFKPLLERGPA